MIIAITGASGVGKTFILKELSSKPISKLNVQFYHFDDIGMPNWDEVDSKNWQRETTIEWIDKLVDISKNDNVHIIFEGSTDFKFYIEGFKKNNFFDYQLLLFDCEKDVMQERLSKRGQSDLYTPEMVNWLFYLRREATKQNVDIIRTNHSTIEEIEEILLNKLK